jgi:dethiobiotin synthetase
VGKHNEKLTQNIYMYLCLNNRYNSDKSQVGKTSICLGLLGALLNSGYSPSELAYIKPATQCEQPQLISKFCELTGVACNGVGPLVFYSGFTRAFLDGKTDNTEIILKKIKKSVDDISKGKRFVVIDGVGYPAVGSICGCSNAVIAKYLNVPTLLVGKRGVGDAVDSFNLNATYFESHGVTVLGVIYNRLGNEGYYSLHKCKSAVTKYFEQYGKQYNLYGFLPELKLAAPGESSIPIDTTENDAKLFIKSFEHNAKFDLLLNSIKNFQEENDTNAIMEIHLSNRYKMSKNNTGDGLDSHLHASSSSIGKKRTRKMIEQKALSGGATGG